jgi:hypothetical protein
MQRIALIEAAALNCLDHGFSRLAGIKFPTALKESGSEYRANLTAFFNRTLNKRLNSSFV